MIQKTRCLSIGVSINENGCLSSSARWQLLFDSVAPAINEAAVKSWMGNVGDDWRTSEGLEPDMMVVGINWDRSSDGRSYSVQFTGERRAGKLELTGAVEERVSLLGERTRKAVFRAPFDTPSNALPQIGMLLDWLGGAFVCDDFTRVQRAGDEWEFQLSAREISTLQLGDVATTENGDALEKKVSFFVAKDNFDSWITAFTLSQACPELFGEDFYLIAIDHTPYGSIGFTVALHAKFIRTRMLRCVRIEKAFELSFESVWQVHSSGFADFENLLGTSVIWAPVKDCIVTAVERTCVSNIEYKITLSARAIEKFIPLGEPSIEYGSDGSVTKTLRFFVANDELDSFLADHPIGVEAIDWAEADFFLDSISSAPEGLIGHQVTLSARLVKTRMLDCVRTERFAGFDSNDLPLREIVYQSTWQVHADQLNDYLNTTGDAAAWADGDNIVTAISPSKISDIEYKLVLEAQDRDNPDLHSKYKLENYSSLANKVDVDARLTDFRLSPRQCGYLQNADGKMVELPDWKVEECPFVTTKPLAVNLVNATLKTVQLTESRYYRRSISANISRMIQWGSSRIHASRVAGYSGSFLREDMSCSELIDNRGARWTKITCVYKLAPDGFKWNPSYWK